MKCFRNKNPTVDGLSLRFIIWWTMRPLALILGARHWVITFWSQLQMKRGTKVKSDTFGWSLVEAFVTKVLLDINFTGVIFFERENTLFDFCFDKYLFNKLFILQNWRFLVIPIYEISMPWIATPAHCFWVYSYWILNVWVSLLRPWIFGIWPIYQI